MITAFELVCLTLKGNLENEKYKILTVQPQGSFEKALADEISYHHDFDVIQADKVNHCRDWEDIHACVGAIPYCGELGYLVKMVREIPTAHNILGIAEAIYEVDMTEGENLYYAVWAITNK